MECDHDCFVRSLPSGTEQVASAPPEAPPFPPPIPPPVVLPAHAETASRLRKWNDRLAIAVGGLTLLLVGAFLGRSWESAAPSDGQVAAESMAVGLAAGRASISVLEEENAEEVNPYDDPVSRPSDSAKQAAAPAADASSAELLLTSAEGGDASSGAAAIAAVPSLSAQNTVSAPDVALTETTAPAAEQEAAQTPAAPAGKVASIQLPPAPAVCTVPKKFQDRKLNTALTWAESPAEAAAQAKEENKLVFLIHVSGNFELPGFT